MVNHLQPCEQSSRQRQTDREAHRQTDRQTDEHKPRIVILRPSSLVNHFTNVSVWASRPGVKILVSRTLGQRPGLGIETQVSRSWSWSLDLVSRSWSQDQRSKPGLGTETQVSQSLSWSQDVSLTLDSKTGTTFFYAGPKG